VEARAKRRLVFSAAAVGLGAAAFMAAVSCLPDISTANVAPFDAGDTGPPPPQPGFCGDGVIDLDAGEQCDPADAAVVGCASCQVTCDGGYIDPATDHCYFGLDDSNNASNANAACENAGAHLVTFASETEFDEVLAWKKGDFWVGLQLDPSVAGVYHPLSNTVVEPGWRFTCEGCYAHVDAGLKDLPRFFPDGGAGIRAVSCVVALGFPELPWETLACDPVLRHGVVCEREPIGTTGHACNGGFCLATRGPTGHRYLFVENGVTAQQAAIDCKSIGATLVVFETHEEREEIARELLAHKSSPPPQLWIGLSRVGAVWTWANGAPETKYPSEWGDNQPLGKTVNFAWIQISSSAFDTQLAHADDGADTTKLPYLCELGN
jgi:Lectin C-type domain